MRTHFYCIPEILDYVPEIHDLIDWAQIVYSPAGFVDLVMAQRAHTQSGQGSDRDATGRYHRYTIIKAPICMEASAAHEFN